MKNTITKLKYESRGVCLGKLWGGGIGAYPTEIITHHNKTYLDLEIDRAVESGTIDSGMGFEKILGALMYTEKITIKEIEGKLYTNREYLESQFYGDLNQEEKDFLLTTNY